MSKSGDKFTKRLVTLLLNQQNKASRGELKIKRGVAGFKSVGEILISDDYLKHIRDGNFLSGEKRRNRVV